MERIVAAVTYDIVQSQRYSAAQRRKIDKILKEEFTMGTKIYKNGFLFDRNSKRYLYSFFRRASIEVPVGMVKGFRFLPLTTYE
jgi:hypothetical protein